MLAQPSRSILTTQRSTRRAGWASLGLGSIAAVQGTLVRGQTWLEIWFAVGSIVLLAAGLIALAISYRPEPAAPIVRVRAWTVLAAAIVSLAAGVVVYTFGGALVAMIFGVGLGVAGALLLNYRSAFPSPSSSA